MILDSITNLGRYITGDENYKKAFEFIEKADLQSLEPGRHEIAGDEVFALIQEYATHPSASRFMEAHNKYADIQIIISGKEIIYYSGNPEGMELHQAYDEDKDCVLYSSGSCMAECRMKDGDFAVFYPNELHKPCCELNGASNVKKAVIKIRMD